MRVLLRLLLSLFAVLALRTSGAAAGEYEQRIQWVMGTPLSIQLPREREDLDELFRACFAEARRWDELLSPWKTEAPLTRLSASEGEWVVLPSEVLDYLERAKDDAQRSLGIFDITLTHGGSSHIEIDRDGSRARLPLGARRLDPGGDGKGVALDAIAAHLDRAGVREAFLDFGGSSFLARGSGPEGTGWTIVLEGAGGEMLGTLRLVDTALSVSSTVQRERLENGGIEERFHLLDLRRDELVRTARSVAVLSPSATEAEVLSTSLAISGLTSMHGRFLDAFPGAAVGLFDREAAPVFQGGFERCFVTGSASMQHER
jgi:thiamine biosynthesis lipoprotein ApbE